jgi:hypothetical protein
MCNHRFTRTYFCNNTLVLNLNCSYNLEAEGREAEGREAEGREAEGSYRVFLGKMAGHNGMGINGSEDQIGSQIALGV